jgi:tRNA(adenine34) deaminase
MDLAIREAERAAAAGEVPVGAVVVREDLLLGAAGNAPIARHDPSAHAEILALRMAARAAGNYRLTGCTLYATLEPCVMCIGAALHARITTVVFGCRDPKGGAAGSVVDLTQVQGMNHRLQVVGGVEEARCRSVVQGFFTARR